MTAVLVAFGVGLWIGSAAGLFVWFLGERRRDRAAEFAAQVAMHNARELRKALIREANLEEAVRRLTAVSNGDEL